MYNVSLIRNNASSSGSSTLPGYEPGKRYYKDQAIVVSGVIYTAKSEFDAPADFDPDDWNKIGVGEADLDAEALIRAQADATLQSGIETEAQTRETADATLQTNIETESTARASADTTLQANINTEATTRAEADDILHDAIDDEIEAREDADDAINLRIGAILGKKSNLTAYDFGTDDKDDLQALLTAYAETQHPEWDDDIPNSVAVNNLFNNHEWIYNKDDDEWIDNGQATVQTATNTQQGIVQGTADDGTPDTEGKVSVIAGTMSVNGFNNKANKIKFPAIPFDGSNLNVAPPRILRFDVAKTPEVTGLGGQGFVAWQVAGHPFHLFGAWTDSVDGDGKTRIGLFQFQNNELTSVRDIFDGDTWLASDWLLTYGINGTRQDVGTLAGFDFATDMTIPALQDYDLKDVGEYLQKKIATSFGKRTVIISEPDGTILGDDTELVTEIPDTYSPALENQVPTVGAVLHGLEEGGKVQSVNEIAPDENKNVQTTVALTKAQFDALEDPPGSGLYPSLKGKDVDITDVEYPDGGLMMVPDYANQEAGNKISTPDGTWTVQRAGFVRMYIGSEASQNKTYNNVFRINGRECYQFYTGGAVVGGSGGRGVVPVNAGDVITAYSYQPANVPTAIQCYFIPPKLVQKLPPIVVEGNGSYSYDEIETNETWVDGRKIYKRTFNWTTHPVGVFPSNWVNTGITVPSDIERIFKNEVSFTDSGSVSPTSNGTFSVAKFSDNTLRLGNYTLGTGIAANSDFFITLYYIKAA